MSSVYACPLSHQLISLCGADKLSYLHGQITQDLNKLTSSNYLWAGHCSAKGKLWGVFKLFSYQDSYYLAGSQAEVEKSDGKVNTSEKVAFTKYGTGEFCSYTEYYSESQKN